LLPHVLCDGFAKRLTLPPEDMVAEGKDVTQEFFYGISDIETRMIYDTLTTAIRNDSRLQDLFNLLQLLLKCVFFNESDGKKHSFLAKFQPDELVDWQ